MICPIHGSEMTEKQGKYGPFFSHKNQDGTWCNGKPPKESYPPQSTYPTKPKIDWEKKDRQTMAQTAMNCASALYQGTEKVEETKQAARILFRELQQMRDGFAGDVAAIGGAIKTIDVDKHDDLSDIPF